MDRADKTEDDDAEIYLLKTQVTRSSLVKAVYCGFKANLAKKPINSTSIDHDNLLSLKNWNELAQTQNTQSYDFDDDDFDMDALLDQAEPKRPKSEDVMEPEERPMEETVTVDLVVRDSSIVIDAAHTYNLPSSVRSSCTVADDDGDHTLFVSLQSGYLFVVKLFDIDHRLQPMVVQDVNLKNYYLNKNSPAYHPKVTSLGAALYSRENIVVLTAVSFNLKFCLCDRNDKVTNSTNFYVNGTFLKSCFIEISSNHLMFLTLICTSFGKLQFRLFEKWEDETLDQISQYSPTLLPNDFRIPLHITSVPNHVILLYSDELMVLGLNYFISCEFSDCARHDLPGKLTSYHVPKAKILHENGFLIATADGSIYSIGVQGTAKLETALVYRSASLGRIDHFSMVPTEDGYKLVVSAESSSTITVYLDETFSETDSEKQASWAPLIDIAVVENGKTQEQELWALGHTDKRTALFQLHKGYRLDTQVVDPLFKDADQLFKIDSTNGTLLVFNYSNGSKMCKLYDSELKVIELEGLDTDRRALQFKGLTQEIAVYATTSSLMLLDIETESLVLKYQISETIVMCDALEGWIALVFRHGHQLALEILQYQGNDLVSKQRIDLTPDQQPSMLKSFVHGGKNYFAVGFFNADVVVYELDTQEAFAISFAVLKQEFFVPHDMAAVGDKILVSSRNGYYSVFNNTFENPKFVKLSDSPVKFTVESADSVLLFSKEHYYLALKRSIYPTKCYLKSSSSTKYSDMVFLESSKEILTLTSHGLNISTLGGDPNSTITLNKIRLHRSCRKVFHLQNLRMFLVLAGLPFSLESNLFKDRLIMVNRQTKKKMQVQDAGVFDKDDALVTLTDWKFDYRNDRGEEKCHYQLLFSCYNAAAARACVKVVEIKKIDNENVKLSKLFQWTASRDPELSSDPGAEFQRVHHIRQVANSTIVYSLGSRLYQICYDFDMKKFGQPACISVFKSKIEGINVGTSSVFVNLANDGVVRLFNMGNMDRPTVEMKDKDESVKDVFDAVVGDSFTAISAKYNNVLKVFKPEHYYKRDRWASFKTESLLKLSQGQFKARWDGASSRSRFVACGLSGDISVYTVISKSAHQKLESLLKHKRVSKLHSLNYLDEWYPKYGESTQIIDSGKLDELEVEDSHYDDEVDVMLNGVNV